MKWVFTFHIHFPSLAQENEAHFRELRQLVNRYDKDKSGGLNVEELTQCIKTYSDERQWTLTPVFPTEEEISLIIQAAGKHKKNDVDASEIEFAIRLWHSYVENRDTIQQVFDKYDTNHSHKLEFDQLQRYLTDLNGGTPPKASTPHHLCSMHGLSTVHLRAGARGPQGPRPPRG